LNVTQSVRSAVEPYARQLGLELWDVVYVKEGPSWFLRIIIDKPGGVSLDDCESLSRAADSSIEALDIPEHEYYLEVSSPGLGRHLKTQEHLLAYLGKKVAAHLIRADADGVRDYEGALVSYDNDCVTIDCNGMPTVVQKSAAAYFKACDDDTDLDLKGIL
ncbi:MAG: ribosome maturation factor RimP, partial [Oscillospiraceae bacterium]